MREARIALGGVASVPWRARESEELLKGKILNEALRGESAAEAAPSDAEPRIHA